MSKISQKILTLLLVIALLFSVCATTVFAATTDSAVSGSGSASGNDEGVKPEDDKDSSGELDSGSLTKGWIDIKYVGNEVTVFSIQERKISRKFSASSLK